MWLKGVLNDKKYYGSRSVMKKLILYFFVAMLFPLPSFAEERILLKFSIFDVSYEETIKKFINTLKGEQYA